MKYKAIIFDMDGTILETEHIWEEATRSLIISRGFDFTAELKHELDKLNKGNLLHSCCKNIKDILSLDDEIEDLVREKTKLAQTMYEHDLKFVTGFHDFHKKVIENNLKTALATNAVDDFLNIVKKNKSIKLDELFGHHIYNPHHVNFIGKPHPDLYLHAAKQIEIHPEDCIAIEDTPTGILSAKSAGMKCIGIDTGKNKDFLKQSDLIIDDYNELDLEKIIKK